jgi:predicted Zn-ribbon and HTH transcriptional regulator
MNPPVRFLCPQCKADAVLRDAFAEWDEETQEWSLSSVFDSFSCNSCGAEFKDPDEEEIENAAASDHGEEQASSEA